MSHGNDVTYPLWTPGKPNRTVAGLAWIFPSRIERVRVPAERNARGSRTFERHPLETIDHPDRGRSRRELRSTAVHRFHASSATSSFPSLHASIPRARARGTPHRGRYRFRKDARSPFETERPIGTSPLFEDPRAAPSIPSVRKASRLEVLRAASKGRRASEGRARRALDGSEGARKAEARALPPRCSPSASETRPEGGSIRAAVVRSRPRLLPRRRASRGRKRIRSHTIQIDPRVRSYVRWNASVSKRGRRRARRLRIRRNRKRSREEGEPSALPQGRYFVGKGILPCETCRSRRRTFEIGGAHATSRKTSRLSRRFVEGDGNRGGNGDFQRPWNLRARGSGPALVAWSTLGEEAEEGGFARGKLVPCPRDPDGTSRRGVR